MPAGKTDDGRGSCSPESVEAYTFTTAKGRNDVRAILDVTFGVSDQCTPSVKLSVVAWGVEVASVACTSFDCAPVDEFTEFSVDTSALVIPCVPTGTGPGALCSGQ